MHLHGIPKLLISIIPDPKHLNKQRHRGKISFPERFPSYNRTRHSHVASPPRRCIQPSLLQPHSSRNATLAPRPPAITLSFNHLLPRSLRLHVYLSQEVPDSSSSVAPEQRLWRGSARASWFVIILCASFKAYSAYGKSILVRLRIYPLVMHSNHLFIFVNPIPRHGTAS